MSLQRGFAGGPRRATQVLAGGGPGRLRNRYVFTAAGGQRALSMPSPLDMPSRSDFGLCKSTVKPPLPHLTCASLAKCRCPHS